MPPDPAPLRVILIGGSSHAGKSTVAQALAAQLGWTYLSTDKLAKHPGRPWRAAPKTVPEHVAAHYLALSPDDLIADVMRHYRDTVWPLVETLVAAHAREDASESIVLEGSALLPELVTTMTLHRVGAVWLTAADALFAQRIRSTSEYDTKSPLERQTIDAFLGRTLRYNRQLQQSLEILGLAPLPVENFPTVDALAAACLAEVHRRVRE